MDFEAAVGRLAELDHHGLHDTDFLLTWDLTDDEVAAVLAVADALRALRRTNRSCRVFDSGLAVSLFRDNSTRTRFSLRLGVQPARAGGAGLRRGHLAGGPRRDRARDRDDGLVHGRRRSASATTSTSARGTAYMADLAGYLTESHRDGVLEQRPTVVNLQSDVDHPTQSVADLLHLAHRFGGVENLRGRKLAMTWAHSPSYGKPLSVPQGMVGPDDPARDGRRARPPTRVRPAGRAV